jgi:hypothetical protein
LPRPSYRGATERAAAPDPAPATWRYGWAAPGSRPDHYRRLLPSLSRRAEPTTPATEAEVLAALPRRRLDPIRRKAVMPMWPVQRELASTEAHPPRQPTFAGLAPGTGARPLGLFLGIAAPGSLVQSRMIRPVARSPRRPRGRACPSPLTQPSPAPASYGSSSLNAATRCAHETTLDLVHLGSLRGRPRWVATVARNAELAGAFETVIAPGPLVLPHASSGHELGR